MTKPSADDGVLRRHFVAVASSTYDDETFQPLPLATSVKQLRDWLGDTFRLGGRAFPHVHPELAEDPDEDQIRAAFHKPSRLWTARDAAVVFVTGHGEVADGSHWLALRESERDDLPNTGLRTGQLISWLRRRDGVEHLLLIVDACFAGKIAGDTVSFDTALPPTWLVLPSAAKDGKATAGALTTAIGKAVAKLGGNEGAKFGTNRRFFRVSDFIDTVREFLPGQQMDPLYRGVLNAEHVCLPNPHYATPDTVPTTASRHDLALPRRDLDTHWGPRAAGSTDGRWLFTGRADLMRELISLTDPTTAAGEGPRVTVVTGRAGCGKSAVLARLVTLSDPQFVDHYRARINDIPDDLRPAPEAVDVAVLATGKFPHEVLGQLSAAIGAPAPWVDGGYADLQAHIAACRTALDQRVRTLVVVDALDEAEDPMGIARMLNQLADSPTLRLIIGVRSPAGTDDPAGTLADQVQTMLGASRLRVDEDPWWHQPDIGEYAASILLHAPNSPYQPAQHNDRARQLAGVIADRVGRSFLVARLAATALTDQQTVADPTDPTWQATLDDDVVGVFRADLRRLRPDPVQRLATVELLRAVAFGYGRGLPWGEIWPLVANAVADRRVKYGDRDIADLLASPFAAYLTTDQEDDTTVYRLFHDALRRTLRTGWRELLTNPTIHGSR